MKRYTKSISAIVASMVLALIMSITSFAAPSAQAGITSRTSGIIVTSPSNTPSLSDPAVRSLIRQAGFNPSDASIVASFDLVGTTDNGTVQLNVPTTLVPAGSSVITLHFFNGAWQLEQSSYRRGILTITGLPNELSPFALVVDSQQGKVAPKTGESGVVVAVGVLLFTASAIILTSKKKQSF